MGILDEIEGQAATAAHHQASAEKLQHDTAFLKALKRRSPLYKTLAVVGALVPFLGWAVTMFTYILIFTATKGGDTKKTVSDALMVGFGWGVLTFLLTLAAFALGYSSSVFLIFYAIAALLVYFTFAGCKRVSRLVQVSEEAIEYINQQS